MLGDGDDRNLERLGLPSADEIKTLAADPKVHAFILAQSERGEAPRPSRRPGCSQLSVADVALSWAIQTSSDSRSRSR